MKGTTMNELRKVQRWLAAVAVAGMATGAGAQVHSADVGADGRISRAELLRVLELAQSDGFHCAEGGSTQDGYAPGPGERGCDGHSSDFLPRDWRVSLSEFLRLMAIERSDGYFACNDGVDDFCTIDADKVAAPKAWDNATLTGFEGYAPGDELALEVRTGVADPVLMGFELDLPEGWALVPDPATGGHRPLLETTAATATLEALVPDLTVEPAPRRVACVWIPQGGEPGGAEETTATVWVRVPEDDPGGQTVRGRLRRGGTYERFVEFTPPANCAEDLVVTVECEVVGARGYTPGQPLDVRVRYFPPQPPCKPMTAFGLELTMPPGWTFQSFRTPALPPNGTSAEPGDTDTVQFNWLGSSGPGEPGEFYVRLNAPLSATGTYTLRPEVIYRRSGAETRGTTDFVIGPEPPPQVEVPSLQEVAEDLLAAFSQLDGDDDGLLTFQEALPLLNELLGLKGTSADPAALFDDLDANGDGLLAVSELRNAAPDGPVHAADQDGDGAVSLTELLRVIQFFNSGGLHCAADAGATEDGYTPGAGASTCAVHSSDYNPEDWQVGLSELLRLIQFFNSGGYTSCPEDGKEDGFCVGAG